MILLPLRPASLMHKNHQRCKMHAAIKCLLQCMLQYLLLNSALVRCEELCRSWRKLSPWPSASIDNILLNLHNSSHPTQPHSITAICHHTKCSKIIIYYSQLSLRRTPLGPALSVRLIESQIKGVRKAGTNSKCLFYRGVCLIEVCVKRDSTVIL